MPNSVSSAIPRAQIERLDGTGTAQVTVESDLAGVIQKAYFADGTDVLAEVSGKTLTLEKEKLPKYDEDMGEDVPFTVETDKALYLCTVDLYTQIIDDVTEFNNFINVGMSVYAQENAEYNTKHYGGYFILGSDIDFEHGLYMLDDADNATRVFYGTLDGRGHVVKDLGPEDTKTQAAITYAGLFQCFGDGAVVRNIAFENFSRNSGMGYSSMFASSLESSDAHVTLENIYLHITEVFYASSASDWSSILLNGHWNWANIEPYYNVKVNNIIICADNVGGGSGTTDIFGQFAKNSTNVQNVYTYGLGNIKISKNDDKTDRNALKDIFALYATREDMIAAAPERDFSDFYAEEADGFWTEVDGLPYPAKLDQVSAN